MKIRAKFLRKKTVVLVISGLILISGATAGALMLNNSSDKSQKSNSETVKSPENLSGSSEYPSTPPTVTPTTPVEPSATETPQPTPSPTPTVSNPYPADSSTWYIFDKRQSVNKTIGSWGAINSWINSAKQSGLLVNNSPQQYDILVLGGGYFVESVNADGSIVVSSHNEPIRHGNVGTITETISASDISLKNYQFIH